MTYAQLSQRVAELGLALRGGFDCDGGDGVPEGARSVVMIGPDEQDFWSVFKASAEFQNGQKHPLDRWSKRMGDRLAAEAGGWAIYPYDGPPYPPFLAWAEKTGQCFASPVGLLVDATAGLFISYRFALALPFAIGARAVPLNPCDTCETKPCLTACPVSALSADGPYDVPRCVAHIRSDAQSECRQGCLARRACPVSIRFGRRPEQSAFHMRAFLGE